MSACQTAWHSFTRSAHLGVLMSDFHILIPVKPFPLSFLSLELLHCTDIENIAVLQAPVVIFVIRWCGSVAETSIKDVAYTYSVQWVFSVLIFHVPCHLEFYKHIPLLQAKMNGGSANLDHSNVWICTIICNYTVYWPINNSKQDSDRQMFGFW